MTQLATSTNKDGHTFLEINPHLNAPDSSVILTHLSWSCQDHSNPLEVFVWLVQFLKSGKFKPLCELERVKHIQNELSSVDMRYS